MTANHRVLFRLIGTKSNRAAIGARVSVTTSKMTQIDEVHAGGSYNRQRHAATLRVGKRGSDE